jgi:hypothetical protein
MISHTRVASLPVFLPSHYPAPQHINEQLETFCKLLKQKRVLFMPLGQCEENPSVARESDSASHRLNGSSFMEQFV